MTPAGTAAGRRLNLALRAAGDQPPPATVPSPEAATLAAEQRASLLNALNRLRLEDRQVIAFRFFSELTEAEMADLLGVARGTVKSRLSRALGRLKTLLTGEAPEREARDG